MALNTISLNDGWLEVLVSGLLDMMTVMVVGNQEQVKADMGLNKR